MDGHRQVSSHAHVGNARLSRRNLLLASGYGLAGAGAALLVGCGKDDDRTMAFPPQGRQLPAQLRARRARHPWPRKDV